MGRAGALHLAIDAGKEIPMRTLFIATVVLAASTGVAGAVCMNPYSGMATGDDCSVDRDAWTTWHSDNWTAADTNQDGMISPEEWAGIYAGHYVVIDANQDSIISSDEWVAVYPNHDLAVIDADKDGMISLTEWSAAYTEPRYNDVDLNQDGMVSVEEWQEGYDRDFDTFDADKNGTLSQEELEGDMQRGS
jgi:hypothetical protein